MKHRTKVYALSGVCGALALLIAFGLVFSPANSQRRAIKVRVLSAKSKEKTASIAMEVAGQSLSMKKGADGWIMEKAGKEFPASSKKVEAFLDALSSMGEAYKVSSKKSTYASFGLEPASKKIALAGADGKAIADLTVGNAETGGKRIYTVIGGKETVYSVKDVLSSYLRTDDRTWADLRVVRRDFKDGDIQEISVRADLPATEGQEAVKEDYRLIRDAKKGWKVVGNDAIALDKAKVDVFAKAVSGLEADSFAAEKEEEAKKLLETPVGTLSFKSGDGKEYRITISAADSEKKHALKEEAGSALAYTSAWTARNVLKTLESLKVAEPPKESPESGKK